MNYNEEINNVLNKIDDDIITIISMCEDGYSTMKDIARELELLRSKIY